MEQKLEAGYLLSSADQESNADHESNYKYDDWEEPSKPAAELDLFCQYTSNEQ
jgi:hypothetical protein